MQIYCGARKCASVSSCYGRKARDSLITGELKSKVDRIWDTMWSGGISNPLSVIEQLTYLLFIKRLDELQTLKENKACRVRRYSCGPLGAARCMVRRVLRTLLPADRK